MSDTKQMFRAIINGQSSLKQEMIGEIGKVRLEIQKLDVKLSKKIDGLESKVDKNTKRIDKLGLQLAELADDAPTIEEFEKLENRVSFLEKVSASA